MWLRRPSALAQAGNLPCPLPRQLASSPAALFRPLQASLGLTVSSPQGPALLTFHSYMAALESFLRVNKMKARNFYIFHKGLIQEANLDS